jgi:hypothetical protein
MSFPDLDPLWLEYSLFWLGLPAIQSKLQVRQSFSVHLPPPSNHDAESHLARDGIELPTPAFSSLHSAPAPQKQVRTLVLIFRIIGYETFWM